MIEGYCVKCKAKRPIGDAVEEQMKNGRKAVKGKCPTCGAVMFKILGGKAVAVPRTDSADEVPPAPEVPSDPPTTPTTPPDVSPAGGVPSLPA